MESGLRKAVVKVQSLMGGLSGRSNIAAWVVSGSLAYYLWVKPSHDLNKEYEERAALTALASSYKYADVQKSNVEGYNTGKNLNE